MHIITQIDEICFKNSKSPCIFHEEKYAQEYYSISCDGKTLAIFSAQSKIPPIAVNAFNFIVVGFDQNVIFINHESGVVLKKIHLSCFFYDFKLMNEYLLVISELELIVFDSKKIEEYKRFEFLEYISNVEVNGNKINISLIDGSLVNVQV